MGKLHFGIDVDGVLAHHLPAMLDVVTEMTGKVIRHEDVTDFYFDGIVERAHMDAVFARCMETAFDLPPMPGCHLINELPGKVTIVTHRHEGEAERTTLKWLAHHGIRYDDIVFTRERKSQMGSFDFFVDDAPHNAQDLAQAGVTTFLMEQPYNRHVQFGDLDERIVRISHWDQIRGYLEGRSLWAAAPRLSS